MKYKVILVLFVVLYASLEASVGYVTYIKGQGVVKRAFKEINVKSGLKLEKKDIVKSINNSIIKMKFNDDTLVTIGKNSSLNIADFLYDHDQAKTSKAKFRFLKGAFKVITGKVGKLNPTMFKLSTKTATIGIKGTVIYGNQYNIAFTKGRGYVASKKKKVNIFAGELIKTFKNRAPSTPVRISRGFINVMKDSLGDKQVDIKLPRASQSQFSNKSNVEIKNSIFKNKSDISNSSVKGNTGIYVGH